jgi:hypothetical protein
VPASESETGKRVSKYFATKELAQHFIAEHYKTGSIHFAKLSTQERAVLAVMRQSDEYSPETLLDLWRKHQVAQHAPEKFKFSKLTVAELCEAFYARQVKEKRSYRTLNDDSWRLNKLSAAIGALEVSKCTSGDILRYLESIPPGTNRRSHYKTLRKLWRWAYQLEHIETDPMARMKPADNWGVNAERLSIDLYARILRVTAGLEPPAKDQEILTKYKFLLPYFVLGGLAGLRTCELIRSASDDPVLCWEDILWRKKLIFVRHEVAKQTRARDRRRYIPLEPAAARILEPLAGTGPIMTISVGYLHKLRRKLARLLKIKLPENCFRNSYATYGLTFRSLGDVAKAMGDAESTVKRYYTETLEPGTGKKWFEVTPANGSDTGPRRTSGAIRKVDLA